MFRGRFSKLIECHHKVDDVEVCPRPHPRVPLPLSPNHYTLDGVGGVPSSFSASCCETTQLTLLPLYKLYALSNKTYNQSTSTFLNDSQEYLYSRAGHHLHQNHILCRFCSQNDECDQEYYLKGGRGSKPANGQKYFLHQSASSNSLLDQQSSITLCDAITSPIVEETSVQQKVNIIHK